MPVQALRSVQEHIDHVVRSVRPKRLAAEMKVGDKGFYFRWFKGYRPEKIGRGRIKHAVKKEILGGGDGNELFANLVIIHWNNSNDALYREMVEHVQTINEDVEAVEAIEDDQAHAMIDDLLQRHERVDIYLCVRLNGVRFDEDLIQSRLIDGEDAPAPGAAKKPKKKAKKKAKTADEDAPAADAASSAEGTSADATEATDAPEATEAKTEDTDGAE